METDLHKLLREQGIPDWARAELKQMPNRGDEYALLRSIPAATVDLREVVGCRHVDYYGLSWLDLLGQRPEDGRLKRLDRSLRDLAADGGEYLLSGTAKSTWSFALFDGELYIDSGMHRSVVGRFFLQLNGLAPDVRGVPLAVYQRRPAAPRKLDAPAPRPSAPGLLARLRDFLGL